MSKFDPNAFARRALIDAIFLTAALAAKNGVAMNVAEEAVRLKAEHPTAADTVDEIAGELRRSAVRFGAAAS